MKNSEIYSFLDFKKKSNKVYLNLNEFSLVERDTLDFFFALRLK